MVDVDGDGLVTRWRDYFDLKEIDAQLPSGEPARLLPPASPRGDRTLP